MQSDRRGIPATDNGQAGIVGAGQQFAAAFHIEHDRRIRRFQQATRIVRVGKRQQVVIVVLQPLQGMCQSVGRRPIDQCSRNFWADEFCKVCYWLVENGGRRPELTQ